MIKHSFPYPTWMLLDSTSAEMPLKINKSLFESDITRYLSNHITSCKSILGTIYTDLTISEGNYSDYAEWYNLIQAIILLQNYTTITTLIPPSDYRKSEIIINGSDLKIKSDLPKVKEFMIKSWNLIKKRKQLMVVK